jgi:ribosomal protein uL24
MVRPRTDSVEIVVHQRPQIQIEGDTIQCYGNPMLLIASGGENYLWNDGSTNDSIVVLESTSLSVTVTNTWGCLATHFFNTRIDSLPTITINGDYEICQGEISQLIAQSDAPILWSTSDTLSSIFVNPSLTTQYSVTATNSFGCHATDTVEIIVHNNPSTVIIGKKKLPVRKGDTVKIMVGDNKGKTGKIEKVDYTKERVFIKDIKRSNNRGQEKLLPFVASNLLITDVVLTDIKRISKKHKTIKKTPINKKVE